MNLSSLLMFDLKPLSVVSIPIQTERELHHTACFFLFLLVFYSKDKNILTHDKFFTCPQQSSSFPKGITITSKIYATCTSVKITTVDIRIHCQLFVRKQSHKDSMKKMSGK